MKKSKFISQTEKLYIKAIQKKSPNEKLKMLDGFFMMAKKINPNYFKCLNQLKIRQIS